MLVGPRTGSRLMTTNNMLTKLNDMVWQRIRASYYAFDWMRRMPFSGWLGKAVHAWEMEKGYGDSPKEKARWDVQFGAGQWEYMRNEESRYEMVTAFLRKFSPGGEILDLGCGAGILFSYVKKGDYQRYVGVDISQVAINSISSLNDSRHHFCQGDADVYEPDGKFDAIVLNESLYYLREPVASLHRYAAFLKPSGVFIVSTYSKSRRALAILRDVRREFQVQHEAATSRDDISWFCTVFRGRREN